VLVGFRDRVAMNADAFVIGGGVAGLAAAVPHAARSPRRLFEARGTAAEGNVVRRPAGQPAPTTVSTR
jgi:thioredoxin reductase